MKVIERLGVLTVLSGALLFTQSAVAYVLNYTSQPLPFIEGYLNGDVNENVGSPELTPLSFNVFFNSAGGSPTVALLSGNVTIDIPDYPISFNSVPASHSSLTLNSDGSIAGWDFSFVFEQHIPQSDDQPYDSKYYVESHYGANTCNCDSYKNEWDLYIRRQDDWQYISTLGFLYSGPNSIDNWIIETVDVPEPRSYVLIFLGLIAIGLTRMRKKSMI
jgi:hypothetical protein